jgi:hypothetical protein
MRLRALRKLEEMELRKERAALAKPSSAELTRPCCPATQRQRTRLKKRP